MRAAGSSTGHDDISHSLHGDGGIGWNGCHGDAITSASPPEEVPSAASQGFPSPPANVRAALKGNCHSCCYCHKNKANFPQNGRHLWDVSVARARSEAQPARG